MFIIVASTPVLCLKRSRTGAIVALSERRKEVSPDLVQLVAKGTGNTGHTRVIVQSDTEPIMRMLVGRLREEDPSHSAGGPPPPRIRATVEWARKAACADRATVPDDHPILTWVVRHADSLHSRHHVGPNGPTSWERLAGKRSSLTIAVLLERVMFMTRGPNRERQ